MTSNVYMQQNDVECRKHRRAHSVGEPVNLISRCECCAYPSQRREISGYCFSLSELFYLGEGIVGYFVFISLVTVWFAVVGLAVGVALMVLNSSSANCQEAYCDWMMRVSWAPGADADTYTIQTYIISAVSLLSILGVELGECYIMNSMNSTNKYQAIKHPHKYSVLLRFTHAQNYTQSQIKTLIEDWWQLEYKIHKQKIPTHFPTSDFINSIIFCFNMEKFLEIMCQIHETENYLKSKQQQSTFRKLSTYRKNSDHSLLHAIQQVQELKQSIQPCNLQKTNKCIVVFRNAEIVEYFVSENRRRWCQNRFNELVLHGENYVRVEHAPYPQEIVYSQTSYVGREKCRVRGGVWGVCAGMMGLWWGCMVGLVAIWNEDVGKTYMGIITGLVGAVLALFQSSIITYLVSQYQHRIINPEVEASIAHKLSTIYFVQFAILLPSSYAIFDTNFLITSGGFIDAVFFAIISLIIFHPIGNFINYHTISQYYLERQVEEGGNQRIQSQKEANYYYEKVEWRVGPQYGWYLGLVYFSAFMLPFMPVCGMFTFISFVLDIILERVRLLKSREPTSSTSQLCYHMYQIIKKFPIFMMLANTILLIVTHELLEQLQAIPIIINCIVLVLSFYSFFLPNSICHPKPSIQDTLYSELKQKMFITYEAHNPIYHYHKQNETKVMVCHSKSQALLDELNTMSKSLQNNLKDRLFRRQQPLCLEQIGIKKEESDEMYFQYERKVEMPKPKKANVPLLFKPSKQPRLSDKFESQRSGSPKFKGKQELVHFNKLFASNEEDEEIKKQFLGKLRKSILIRK